MSSRFWWYGGAVIIALGLLLHYQSAKSQILATATAATDSQNSAQSDLFNRYLEIQKSAPKLISLAKRLSSINPNLVQPIIERAYAIDPNNRDALVLASVYHPELKMRVEQVDPLYGRQPSP